MQFVGIKLKKNTTNNVHVVLRKLNMSIYQMLKENVNLHSKVKLSEWD